MSELPPGWTESPLVDLISEDGLFSDGDWVESKDQDPNGAIRLLQLADIGDGKFLNKSNRFVNDEKFELLNCEEVLEGDVLVARMPDPLGRACLMPNLPRKCITVVDVAIVRPGTETISTKWLMHFLNSPQVRQEMQLRSSGSTRKRISRGNLSQIVLPVPPPNEQKRIADKLDALLARADSCERHLERVPQILKRFRQSVLAAATSGRLTEGWRGTQGKNLKPWIETIPEGGVPLPEDYDRLGKIAFKLTPIEHSAKDLPGTWALLTIADLYETKALIDFADGNHGAMYPRKEDFGDKGALFLTATQIGENWEVDIYACPRLRSDKAEKLVKGWARKNDVLLTHNATVGRVALLEFGEEDVLLGTSVTFYRFNEKYILPNYGRILFSSPFFQDQLKMEMAQTTRNQVPITKQVSFNFICPPLEEQAEIVRRVEKLFAYADRLEARYLSASERVERLTPSLLAKAFRGELVGQDPNDESASALVERIRETRDAQKAGPSGKSKKSKRS